MQQEKSGTVNAQRRRRTRLATAERCKMLVNSVTYVRGFALRIAHALCFGAAMCVPTTLWTSPEPPDESPWWSTHDRAILLQTQ